MFEFVIGLCRFGFAFVSLILSYFVWVMVAYALLFLVLVLFIGWLVIVDCFAALLICFGDIACCYVSCLLA